MYFPFLFLVLCHYQAATRLSYLTSFSILPLNHSIPKGSDVSVVGTLGRGEMARNNARAVDDDEEDKAKSNEADSSMSRGFGFSSGEYTSSLLGTSSATAQDRTVKVEASSSLPSSLLPSSPTWASSFFTTTTTVSDGSSSSSNVVDEDAAGREVAFEDTSTEWAL